jgi:beta-lactamase superfamily II metal-dependent hydrolase
MSKQRILWLNDVALRGGALSQRKLQRGDRYMADFFEVDFLGVETKSSGDAIALRYSIGGGPQAIHVVDGGYIATGEKIVEHIRKHYGSTVIDNVVLTHPDRDHANGLRKVLEDCTVRRLWMHRPWNYAEQLLPSFPTYSSADRLRSKLRSVYAAPVELETIALEKGIPIAEPFQGQMIGPFNVMAPTFDRWLECVVDSNKTPETANESTMDSALANMWNVVKAAAAKLKAAAWGEEYFPPEGTSAENEMSVVQYAFLNNTKVLLTGDTGRDGLQEAIDYAPAVGLTLPGITLFQVPHHGGRHNVSTEVLDQLHGPRLSALPEETAWTAICSSAKEDADHPRLSVKRAMLHRGAHFAATEGRDLCFGRGISREGWSAVPQETYPYEQED